MLKQPTHFYKYRSLASAAEAERVRATVVQDRIYFSSPTHFNDPFDLHPAVDLSASPEQQRRDYVTLAVKHGGMTEAEALSEADYVMQTSMSPARVAETAQLVQAMHTAKLQNIGVFCVTTKPDDILMWSHYAHSHRGICLEFSAVSRSMAEAQKVLYRQKRKPMNPYRDSNNTMMEKALLTKSHHWFYESEYRLLRPTTGPGSVTIGPDALTAIIIGANAEASTLELVRGWNQEREKPIRLYRASVSRYEYELNFSVSESQQ